MALQESKDIITERFVKVLSQTVNFLQSSALTSHYFDCQFLRMHNDRRKFRSFWRNWSKKSMKSRG